MNYLDVIYSFAIIVLALAIGYLIVKLPFLRKYYIPASLVAGLVLLAFGPELAGRFMPEYQLDAGLYEYWAQLPGQLINVVFACLFLAHSALPIRQIWRQAAPQAAFGQMMAWGQYALGGLVTMAVLIPLFSASPLSAALIEISFEGGHGTASGLAHVFDQLNFAVGREMAVALATLSLNAALICGIVLINWGRKKGYIRQPHHRTVAQMVYHRRVAYELRKQGISIKQHFSFKRVASHLALVAVAVAIGWALHQGLLFIESMTWGKSGVTIFGYMPLFTFCMFGGLIARKIWRWLRIEISRPIVETIGSATLSLLIVTAIASMSFGFVSTQLEVFVILAVVGIVWILLSFLIFAPRMFGKNWFQNGIVNMGQSMGQTATGLLFVKMADPKNKTDAMESFGYKQLLFEPFVGGGIVTALSMPAIIYLGLPLFTAIAAGVCVVWLLLGVTIFRRYK